jgi:hypothetical protein
MNATDLITKPELKQKLESLETFVDVRRHGGFYQALGSCKNILKLQEGYRKDNYDKLCVLSRQSGSFHDYGYYFDSQDENGKNYQKVMLKDWLEHNPEVRYHPAYKHVFTEKQQSFLRSLTQGFWRDEGDETNPDTQNRSPSFREACQKGTEEKHPLIGRLSTATTAHNKALWNAENVVKNCETMLEYWIQKGREAFSKANLTDAHPESDEWNRVSQQADEILQLAQEEIQKLSETVKETMQALEANYQSPQQVVDAWLKEQELENEKQEPKTETIIPEPPAIQPRDDVFAAVVHVPQETPAEPEDLAAEVPSATNENKIPTAEDLVKEAMESPEKLEAFFNSCEEVFSSESAKDPQSDAYKTAMAYLQARQDLVAGWASQSASLG